MTHDELVASALHYNAPYCTAEDLDAIACGTPVLSATSLPADRTGRAYRLVMRPAILLADGGVAAATPDDAIVERVERRDGRQDVHATCRRRAERRAASLGLDLHYNSRT